MKRIISALLVLILLLPCAVSAEEILHRFDQTFFTSQFLGENTAWVMDLEGKVFRWNYDDKEPEHVLDVTVVNSELYWDYGMPYGDLPLPAQEKMNDAVTLLLADGDKLYVLNTYAGRIGTADENGVQWLLSFDAAPFFQDDGWERSINGSAVVDHKAYLLLAGNGQQTATVVEINLETGSTRFIDAPNSRRIAGYKAGKLLIIATEDVSSNLYELDIASGERTLLCGSMPGTEALCYDKTSDTVYVGSDSGIYALGENGFVLRMNLPTSYLYGVAQIIQTGKLAYCTQGIWVVSIPDASLQVPVLTAYMQGEASTLTSMFTASHPNALLDVRMDLLTTGDIANRIRSGDDVADVFCVQVDSAFTQLKAKNFAAPLQNTDILDSVSRLYPSIASLLVDEQGNVVAYPWYVSAQGGWSVNKDLWQKYFGDTPYPVTWKEFFIRMNEFHALQDEENVFVNHWSYPSMLRQVLRSFILNRSQAGGRVDFSDPSLRETLQVMALVQQELQSQGIESYDEGMFAMDYEEMGTHSLFSPNYAFDSNALSPMLGSSLPPFVFEEGETPVYQGNISVLIVNPLSKNRELAESYIRSLTTMEYSPMHYYLLHTDATQPFNEEPYLITSEDISAWQQAVSYANFADQTPLLSAAFIDQMNSLISRYAAGQLDLNGFLKKLNETAHMVELETE